MKKRGLAVINEPSSEPIVKNITFGSYDEHEKDIVTVSEFNASNRKISQLELDWVDSFIHLRIHDNHPIILNLAEFEDLYVLVDIYRKYVQPGIITAALEDADCDED